MILDDILIKLKMGNQDIAYTIDEQRYTYSEFYKYICNIYDYLLKNNVDKNPVIVYGNKEIYMKSAFLACSFAGITYVPIDESTPNERVEAIINQINPYCIIGDFKYKKIKNISKKDIYDIMDKEKIDEIEKIYLNPNDVYYIIFTSGSTGTPKGVEVLYRNLDSCIKWLLDITSIKKGVILNQAIYSFDLSVADLYLSIATGSEHFIINNKFKFDFKAVFNELSQSNVTMAVMTPSFADFLLIDRNFGKEILPKLNTILFCGERLLTSTVRKLNERFDNLKIINSYGPTECTFAVTSVEITTEHLRQENLPIGIPKKDVDIYIVNKDLENLGEEKIGEILISGESVAKGYVNNINNNSFIIYRKKPSYLTGDLGFIKNGMLYYVSRGDNQIKYKGYRIEIADIESAFYSIDYVEKVIIVSKKDKEDTIIKLIAFVQLKREILKDEIQNNLKDKIPLYMIPVIKIVKSFPINQNGKIDLKELRRIADGK